MENQIIEVLNNNNWNVLNVEYNYFPSANDEGELKGLFTGLKIETGKKVNAGHETFLEIYELKDGRISIDFFCINESDNYGNEFYLDELERVLNTHMQEELESIEYI